MTDPNSNPYGAPAPQSPAPEQPQYQAPAQPQYQAPSQPQYQAPTPAQGMPAASSAQAYAANIQSSVTNFAQQMGGKNVNVGGQTFDYISILTFIGAVVTILGCALPFASINVSMFGQSLSDSISLFSSGDGWFFLAFAVAVVVVTVLKKHLAALILSAIDLALGIFEVVYTNKKIEDAVGSYGSIGDAVKNAIHYGVGAWLIIIAGVAMVVGTLLAFLNQRRARSSAAPSGFSAPQAQASYGAAPTPFPGAVAPSVPAPSIPTPGAPIPPVPAPSVPAAPVQQNPFDPQSATANNDKYNGQVPPTATPEA